MLHRALEIPAATRQRALKFLGKIQNLLGEGADKWPLWRRIWMTLSCTDGWPQEVPSMRELNECQQKWTEKRPGTGFSVHMGHWTPWSQTRHLTGPGPSFLRSNMKRLTQYHSRSFQFYAELVKLMPTPKQSSGSRESQAESELRASGLFRRHLWRCSSAWDSWSGIYIVNFQFQEYHT